MRCSASCLFGSYLQQGKEAYEKQQWANAKLFFDRALQEARQERQSNFSLQWPLSALTLARAGTPLLNSSIKQLELILGKDNSWFTLLYLEVAFFSLLERNDQQAQKALDRALEIYEKTKEANSELVSPWFSLISRLYMLKGNYKNAETLHTRILSISEKVHGRTSFETIAPLNNLISFYKQLHKYEEACLLCQKVIAIEQELLPRATTALVSSKMELASCLSDAGKYYLAEDCYKSALNVKEQETSQKNSILDSLAWFYFNHGQFSTAETLFRRLSQQPQSIHEGQTVNPQQLHNLVVVYQAEKKYKEAETTCKQMLSAYEHDKGVKYSNVDIGHGLWHLCKIYDSLHQPQRAETLAKWGIAILRHNVKTHARQALDNLRRFAYRYSECGNVLESEQLFQEIIKIAEDIADKKKSSQEAIFEERSELLAALKGLADWYSQQARYLETEKLYGRIVLLEKKFKGPEHLDVAEILTNQALCKQQAGKYAQAVLLLSEALAINAKVLGEDTLAVAQGKVQLANCLFQLQQHENARNLITEAFKTTLQKEANLPGPACSCLVEIGESLLTQGQEEKAKACFEKVLVLKRKFGPTEDKDIAAAWYGLGKTYYRKLLYKKAAIALSNALDIYEKTSKDNEQLLVREDIRKLKAAAKYKQH